MKLTCKVWNYRESFLLYRHAEAGLRHESKLFQSDEELIHLASYLGKKKIKTIDHARRLLNHWADYGKVLTFPESKLFRFIKKYDSFGYAVWVPVGN